MRRIQKNGRERGRNQGIGNGSHQEISPMGHAAKTKNKQEIRNQEDRRRKQKGWD